MLFVNAGLDTHVELGNQRVWSCEEDKASYLRSKDFYWDALRANGLSEQEICAWEKEYLKSLEDRIQVNFFPQFYAIGIKR